MKILRLKYIALIFIGFLFIQCTPNNTSESIKQKKVVPVRQKSDGITLDNGKVWKANKATTNGVKNMVTHMNAFKISNNLEDYTLLQKTLEDEIINIFTACNMKGEAHNQLHNYLLPLHELLEPLKSNDITVCKQTVDKIKRQLAIYPLYFE